jgi:molybdate transport system ATP-binding protein
VSGTDPGQTGRMPAGHLPAGHLPAGPPPARHGSSGQAGSSDSGLVFSAVLGQRDLDVHFEVAAGETVALLGSNGAGKSTVVQVIAGLLRPDRGRATLAGRVLFDVDAGVAPGAGPADTAGPGTASTGSEREIRRRTWLPPHARGTALLAQEPLLFPHLSVRDNVAFGPRSAGAGRAASRVIADDWLAQAEVADLAGRRPAELSGGQAQRVAVARALAAHPSLLLLDEPMTALDVAAVPAQRMLLHRVLRERTVLLVTHDPLDALALADRVVVLESGRIVEQGRTREVFARPRTEFTRALTFGLDLGR